MKVKSKPNQQKKKSSFFHAMWKFMFVILLLAGTLSNGQSLSENFEGATFPPTGWFASANTSVPWAQATNASGYGVGTNSAFMDFYDLQTGSEQLNTAPFTPVGSGYYLQFDEAYAAYPGGYNDQLQINYSTDGGLTWSELVLLNGDVNGPLNTGGSSGNMFVPNANQWQTFTLELPVGTNMIQFNGISAFGNELYIDNVTVTNTTCTGTPDAGTIVSYLTDPVCPFNNFSFFVQGHNLPGTNYQWQSSTDNILFTDVFGATSNRLTTNQNNAHYYHCVATCPASAVSAVSDSTFVDLNVNTLPILQDWEGNSLTDNCWSTSQNTPYPWTQVITTSAFGIGVKSAKMDFADLSSGSEQLTSSQFTPSTAGYVLRFEEAYASAFDSDDQLEILISSDGGSNWNQLDLLHGGDTGPLNTGGEICCSYFTPANDQWQTLNYVLPVGTNMVRFNGISAWGNNLYLDNVRIFVPIPCTGTPSAGDAVSNNACVGAGVHFVLGLSGADNTDGLTYQWQMSPNNTFYSDMLGDIHSTSVQSGTSDAWYRCIVTCSNSGASATSNPVFVKQGLQFTWTPLVNQAPHMNFGSMLLMSDGTVIAKSNGGGNDPYGTIFDRLTPDAHGSYVNGTWSTIAPMNSSRIFFSSQIMMDGRVYAAGGEYGSGMYLGETYNPVTDTWTPCNGPNLRLSDANSEILPDGRILQAIVDHYQPTSTVIYDPATNDYVTGPSTFSGTNESVWVKFPDNSFIQVDEGQTTSERYIPSLNTWVQEPNTPVNLYDPYGFETGPGFLLPDGRAFFMGSQGYTAYYTPSGDVTPGTWAAGPRIPNFRGMPDAAGAMMVNGKILFACSKGPNSGADLFTAPTYFYEFDYLTETYTLLTAPNGADKLGIACFQTNMLCLPDGSILYSNHQDPSSAQYYVYTPSGSQLSERAPVIAAVAQSACTNYTITGTGFNGITEGASYGDDCQNNTNYPVIRLTSGTNVYYARTFNWNSSGVQRGLAADTAHFTIPANLPFGTYSLVVTANGLASAPVTFNYNPVPNVSINGSTLICNNNPVTLSASGAVSYVWSNNAVSPSIQATSAGTYTVTATDAGGCTATTSTTVAASIIQIPVITGNGPISLCGGGSVTLSTTSYASYAWSNGGTNASTTVNAGGMYFVTVTNAAGCTAVGQRTVTVLTNPMPNITGTGINNYCNNTTSANLTVGSYASYIWSTGAVSQSIVVAPGNPGTYSVTVTSTNGCTGTASLVLSNACPMPTNLTTSNIAATTAMANWVQPACAYGYTIRISKHNLNTWTSYTVTPNTHFTFSGLSRNTQYDWQIRTNCNASQSSNSGFSNSVVFTTAPRFAAGESAKDEYSFNVFPNPSTDHATVSFNSTKEEDYTVQLVDVTGRIVLSSNSTSVIGENQYQMNLSTIAKGIYNVILKTQETTLQLKIVVQ